MRRVGEILEGVYQLISSRTPAEKAPWVLALRRMKYVDYLTTTHWRRLRRHIIERADRRCQVCDKRRPLQVHHLTYERRGCELHEDLQALCEWCHNRAHAH